MGSTRQRLCSVTLHRCTKYMHDSALKCVSSNASWQSTVQRIHALQLASVSRICLIGAAASVLCGMVSSVQKCVHSSALKCVLSGVVFDLYRFWVPCATEYVSVLRQLWTYTRDCTRLR